MATEVWRPLKYFTYLKLLLSGVSFSYFAFISGRIWKNTAKYSATANLGKYLQCPQ